VHVVRRSGLREVVPAVAAVDTQLEVLLLRKGGVIPTILRQQVQAHATPGV
jgi:aconitate hydratase